MFSNTDTFIIGLVVFHETSPKQFQGVSNIRDISSLKSGTKGYLKMSMLLIIWKHTSKQLLGERRNKIGNDENAKFVNYNSSVM